MGGKFLLPDYEKIKMMNKKSQIGSTLTWFVAFIIIFFIILLFITSSIIIAGQREVNQITLQKYDSSTVELQRDLIRLLNTPVESESGKTSIKGLIKKWDASESEERKNIEKALQQGINQALPSYYFTIYGIDHDIFFSLENNPGESSIISEDESSSIYLISDKGMLRVSLSFNKYESVPI